jgi:hypothetical protein
MEYEFTAEQNDVIGDLARKMRFVGLMGMIVGVFLLLGAIASFASSARAGSAGPVNAIMGAASVLVGAWTRRASIGFQRIVETEGHDIENLMGALAELRRIYALQRILLIVVLLLLVLAVQLYLLFMAGH